MNSIFPIPDILLKASWISSATSPIRLPVRQSLHQVQRSILWTTTSGVERMTVLDEFQHVSFWFVFQDLSWHLSSLQRLVPHNEHPVCADELHYEIYLTDDPKLFVLDFSITLWFNKNFRCRARNSSTSAFDKMLRTSLWQQLQYIQ